MSYVKVYKYKKQISLDNGVTWQDVTPAEYVPSGDPIGYYDTYNDCIAQYRTITSGYTCTGTHGVDKHNLDVYEVSYDFGETWEVVSTSAGTLIEANSEDCGYSARTVSTGTTCAGNHGVNKYQLIENQESYDYGVTWITISSSTGSLIEENSEDCGYSARTVSTGSTCVGVDKYQLIENQVSYDYGSTWTTTATSTGSLIETNSYDCGYRTRQTSGTPYCTGYDKYVDVSNQVSTDYGNTWTTISTASTLVEHNSEDCGYIPPFSGKYKLTLNDSSRVTAACDSTSAITKNELSAYSASVVSVVVGECVRSISGYAFSWNTTLKNVALSDSVANIGEYAFRSCTSLSSVTIGSGVTYIGGDAFNGCSKITSVTIPSGVTTIGNRAFSGCSSLTGITVEAVTPPTLTTGNSTKAFNGTNNCPIYVPCESVGTYKTATGWKNYASRITCIIPPLTGKYGLTLTGSSIYASAPCDSTSAITSGEVSTQYSGTVVSAEIGNCVTKIDDGAFQNCVSLSSVTIPSSVTSIDEYAFYRCRSLSSITIPNGITSIERGTFMFNNFSSIGTVGSGASIEIPNSVTSIGEDAFYGCKATTCTIGGSVTTIGRDSFAYCSNLTSATIGNSVTTIDSFAFEYCTSLSSVTIGSGVTSIGAICFDKCALTSITIPNNVTSIGNSAFDDCTGLTSVTLSNNITTIESGLFSGCKKLKRLNSSTDGVVNILNGVTNIGRAAFTGCKSIVSVNIPSTITSIGGAAFSGCDSLTGITIHATTPPSIGYYGIFDNMNLHTCPIYVPSGSVNAYKTAEGWTRYVDIIYPIP